MPKRLLYEHSISIMKAKVALIILIVIALGLGIGLTVVKQQAARERVEAGDRISVLSDNLEHARRDLEQERSDKMLLETNLADTRTEFSNKLTATEAALNTTAATLTKAQADSKASAEAAAAEIAARDKKISDLEVQNQSLDKTAADLRLSITGLEDKIASTEKKLLASEGDRNFLIKELKRLQTEKADLEKKFNDLAVLRDQVRKLRDEMDLSRRLDWLRRGLYATAGSKGGERLINTTAVPQTNNLLNVELRQDGGVRIQSTQTTNPPAK